MARRFGWLQSNDARLVRSFFFFRTCPCNAECVCCSKYMLWTDASSREFIAEHYSWFLDTFDAYPYPIQRADAIRYFVLHHYGGVYIDLDIGCLRPLDPLLVFPVILPKTIPVGVSNDLMFAEKGHPFMAQTIHNLVTFDHNWILNYPTVMFSTGPMFLSAQYGIYSASHPISLESLGEIRILPKSLYGKNAKPFEAPHSFFSHFYGSSWHADDAAFIGFLGTWGKGLLLIGAIILLLGMIRLALPSNNRRRLAAYDVVLPKWTQRNGRWYLDLGLFALPASGYATIPTSPISPTGSPTQLPLLPLPVDVRSASPASSDMTSLGEVIPAMGGAISANPVVETAKRVGARFMGLFGYQTAPTLHSPRRRTNHQRGVLYFLPALFTPSSRDIEAPSPRLPSRSLSPFHDHRHSRSSSPLLSSKGRYVDDLDTVDLTAHTHRRSVNSSYDDQFTSDDGESSSAWEA